MDKNKSEKDKNEKQLKIDLPVEKSNGQYSNLVLSSVSQEEFVIDFAFVQPHVNKAIVQSRIILSPRNAKKLGLILQKNIEEYESKNGLIDGTLPNQGAQFSFN